MGKIEETVAEETKRRLSTLFIHQKFHLKSLQAAITQRNGDIKELQEQLKRVESADIVNRALQNKLSFQITSTKEELTPLFDAKRNIGRCIFIFSEMTNIIMTPDDLRSIFNVSFSDMEQLLSESSEYNVPLFDLLMHSWWASDTVTMFGQAKLMYLRSNPEIREAMDKATTEWLQSTGVPSYSPVYDEKGEIIRMKRNKPVFKLVK